MPKMGNLALSQIDKRLMVELSRVIRSLQKQPIWMKTLFLIGALYFWYINSFQKRTFLQYWPIIFDIKAINFWHRSSPFPIWYCTNILINLRKNIPTILVQFNLETLSRQSIPFGFCKASSCLEGKSYWLNMENFCETLSFCIFLDYAKGRPLQDCP